MSDRPGGGDATAAGCLLGAAVAVMVGGLCLVPLWLLGVGAVPLR